MSSEIERLKLYQFEQREYRARHGAKLTEDKVREIRRMYATGEWKQSDLADEFGVHYSTISLVVNNKRWVQQEN